MTVSERVKSFQKIDALIKAKGITYFKVANDLGFTPVLFSDWKKGKSIPKVDKMIKLADYFGVDVKYLIS